MNCDYNLKDGEILDEIRLVQEHLEVLRSRLDWLDDARTIEQISYEMLADEKRYEYLLKLAKDRKLHNVQLVLREGSVW